MKKLLKDKKRDLHKSATFQVHKREESIINVSIIPKFKVKINITSLKILKGLSIESEKMVLKCVCRSERLRIVWGTLGKELHGRLWGQNIKIYLKISNFQNSIVLL